MGGIENSLAYIPYIQQGANLVFGTLGHELGTRDDRNAQQNALRDLQASQAQNLAAAEADAASQRAKIAADTAESERLRKAALRRAVARQNANFGAQGIGSANGSSEAVLLGLYNESDAERADREKADTLRLGDIDRSLSERRRLNLMQLEQYRQRQNIGRFSSNFERFGNFTNLGLSLADLYGRIKQGYGGA